jgi:hypothetical protein
VDLTFATLLVVVAALAAANLPFANERLFGLVSLKPKAAGQARSKPFFVRLVELLVLYFLIGLLARALEASIGNVFAQGWEFYAVTGCLFIVLAYPGFVWRYLRKQRPVR